MFRDDAAGPRRVKHWQETRQIYRRLAELLAEGRRAALATVVRVRGSAYRHEGAKLLIAEDGEATGNVSGGCLEREVRGVALQVIHSGTAEVRSYCSGPDEVAAWDLGLGCEGEVRVLVEPALARRSREEELLEGRLAFATCSAVPAMAGEGRLIVTAMGVEGSLRSTSTTDAAALARGLLIDERSALVQVAGTHVFVDVLVPPPELLVCGAGDDAWPLARCASEVGFRVIVTDRRAGLLTTARFPGARLVHCDADRLVERLEIHGSTWAVVMTHNFADDRAYAGALLKTPVAYVGMLGPRQRTERILQDLPGAARDPRVFGPVGLDVGTDGAEQIALSVVAEILAVRSGREARSLREREARIHA